MNRAARLVRRSATPAGSRFSTIFSHLALFVLGALAAATAGFVSGVVPPGRLEALLAGTAAVPPAPQAAITSPAAATLTSQATVLPVEAGDALVNASGAGKPVRDESIGDWRLTCMAADGAESCSALQQLRLAETGAAVFMWRISQSDTGELVSLWQVPEDVQLGAGMMLSAGTPKPIVMPYDSCGGGSCRVVGNLSEAFVKVLAEQQAISVSVVLQDGRPLAFPVSAKGLSAVLTALSR